MKLFFSDSLDDSFVTLYIIPLLQIYAKTYIKKVIVMCQIPELSNDKKLTYS